MWVLAFINLSIYYSACNVLADKIATIATVTLAFVAFLPTVNEKIPQTSMVKLIEIIIYIQIGTTFLTLIDAIENRNMDPTVYETTWNTNACFMITLIINIICAVIVVALFSIHKIWWENIYTKDREERITGKLAREDWENKECDLEFKKLITSEKVVPVTGNLEKVRVNSEKKGKKACEIKFSMIVITLILIILIVHAKRESKRDLIEKIKEVKA